MMKCSALEAAYYQIKEIRPYGGLVGLPSRLRYITGRLCTLRFIIFQLNGEMSPIRLNIGC